MTKSFSHLSNSGEAQMVNVGHKTATLRTAIAEAWVEATAAIIDALIETGGLSKGNVIETARIAGIIGAKKTSDLVPMCHPIMIDCIDLQAEILRDKVRFVCQVECEGKTGVEMEAITAVSIAALTFYDMVKSEEKGIEIGPIRLIEKRGGKSGHWRREADSNGNS